MNSSPEGDRAAESVDLFVIGAGSGGVRAARIAAQSGAKVVIAEEYRVGGTCVIRGCIPKKLMAYAAHFADDFSDAEGFGWSLEAPPRFDWLRLREAVAGEVDRLNGLYRENLARAGVKIVEGRARLVGPQEVEIVGTGRRWRAETILIASGGTPNRPHHIPGGEHAITSNEVFHLPRFPRRLLVVGGGYIAVEFASIFHGLGAEVTLAYRGGPVLRGFDIDLREALQESLIERGIEVRCHEQVVSLDRREDGLHATLASGETRVVDEALFAIGRRPNTEGLGLETAGVECAANGAVIVDDYSRTNVPSIWAVGDVTDRVSLTPVAIREGHAFALTRFYDTPTRPDHREVPSAVFTLPPIGTVGYGEEEAFDRFGEVDVYRARYRPLKHTISGRNERDLIKVLVDAETDRVVGMHMLGEGAPEIIQGFATAMKNGLTKAGLDRTVAIHPTSAEEFVLLRTPVTPWRERKPETS
ncbi:MAG: glutathione-disulfide reductase [Alphaproteobacteria bacterium]|nr:MAG: glutathione-disulfide reductase [Alphaproteobacteria bacterium]